MRAFTRARLILRLPRVNIHPGCTTDQRHGSIGEEAEAPSPIEDVALAATDSEQPLRLLTQYARPGRARRSARQGECRARSVIADHTGTVRTEAALAGGAHCHWRCNHTITVQIGRAHV